MLPKLIGVAGQMRMGKDTVGQMLASRAQVPRRAFAADVKELTRELFGVDDIEGWKCREETPPGMIVPMRRALQMVGDGMRQIQPTVWIERAMARAPEGVFCDVRYTNEAAEIRRRGGIVVLVGRSRLLNDDPNASEAHLRELLDWFLTHTSESCVRVASLVDVPEAGRSFDWFVRNDGSLDELEAAVGRVVAVSASEDPA